MTSVSLQAAPGAVSAHGVGQYSVGQAVASPADPASTVRSFGPLVDVIERLVGAYSELPVAAIIRCVHACNEELIRIGVRSGRVEAVEAMANCRLARHVAACQT